MFSIYFWNIVGFQIIYFYGLCYYLKHKMNENYNQISQMIERKRFIEIKQIIQTFDSIFSEINEYNTTFWSIILLLFLFAFGSATIAILFITIFLPLILIIKLIFIYSLIIYLSIFLFIIFIASSLTSRVNNSYKIFNRLFISFTKQNKILNYNRVIQVNYRYFLIDFNIKLDNYKYIIYYSYYQCLKEWVKKVLDFLFGNYLQLITSSAMK